MSWSPLVRLDTVLDGLNMTLPIIGHTLSLAEGPDTPQQLYVTIQLLRCTARQFDYYLLAGRELCTQIEARATAIAVIDGINGRHLLESSWDHVVEVKYMATMFRGQSLSHTLWVTKE